MPVYFEPVPPIAREGADTFEEYQKKHAASIADPDSFWGEQAKRVTWFKDFDSVSGGTLKDGNVTFYNGGKINACYNAVDRWAQDDPERTAIVWEGDEPTDVRNISYGELLAGTCQIANVLLSRGCKKGDTVTIYMPMVPETAMAMLACARIGAIHSVVFAGFSATALKDRIDDSNSKIIMTADVGLRGTKKIPLKTTVNEACNIATTNVTSVLTLERVGRDCEMVEGRDVWLQDAMANERPYVPCEVMDSEDILFYLYTSGSTGQPKGIAHTTGGYCVYTAMTTEFSFGNAKDDLHACVADVGWITGHSYIVYGPLINGTKTFMFESVPTYPDASRYWDMIQRHKIATFYTAPTALRALMKSGDEPVKKHDLSCLKVLGTVGEPINPEAYRWYKEVVGGNRVDIIDTYWQTETGGHVMTPLVGVSPTKPGSCSFPMYGIDAVILDQNPEHKTPVVMERPEGGEVSGVLAIAKPWPGMARSVFGNHDRYMNVYLRPYPGYYFPGDGARIDKDGFCWITGRTDDVLNTSGHRLGTAEIESALVAHPAVAEAAVVGAPHDIKGEEPFAYVMLMNGVEKTDVLAQELRMQVRKMIGGIAMPGTVVITGGLPKTRSGKIMRRILRKLAAGEYENLGDFSTLGTPAVVPVLIADVKATRA